LVPTCPRKVLRIDADYDRPGECGVFCNRQAQ